MAIRNPCIVAATLLACMHGAAAALGGAPAQFKPSEVAAVTTVPSAAPPYLRRDTTLVSGTQVREYMTTDGIVFAVAWNGPFKPDLRELLGRHFDAMSAQARARPQAGRARSQLARPEVVVQSGGHMRAFEGSAWIPAALPAGFAATDVR